MRSFGQWTRVKALGIILLATACGEEEPDPCTGWDCGAHGQCGLVQGRPLCICYDDYSGERCDEPPVGPVCSPNPCTTGHRTVCADVGGQAICLCVEGYHDDGSGSCAQVANGPCESDPCAEPHRTVCAVIQEVPVCLCEEGYVESGDECVLQPAGPCSPNPCDEPNRTVCRPSGDAAVCSCDEGFHDEDGACVSEDPCTPNPCAGEHQTVCTTDGAEAVCGCDEGFHEAGQSCQPNDPCTESPCVEPNRGVCTNDGGSAVCDCDPGYVENPESGACELPEDPTCSNSHTTGDAYEPNECPPEATPITAGETQAHSINPAGDHDWFAVTAEAGHIYGFTATENVIDLYLLLFDTDGSTALRYQDYPSLRYELPAAGTYYLRVQGYSSSSTGTYTLTVTDLGLDDHGDAAASATALVVDEPPTLGGIETAGDQDWFSFTADAGHIYAFAASESNINLTLRLFDRDGTTMLRYQDFAYFTVELATAGTYYLWVQAYSSTATGGYNVSVTDLGLDDHGDVAASATALVVDDPPALGGIETAGDQDWFSFTADAGHIYAFAASESNIDLTLRLFDRDGTTMLRYQDFAYFTVELATAGTYYLWVQAYSGTTTGGYNVSVTDLGLDDHGDAASSATALVVDDPPTLGGIETAGDRDWFSFTADAGHIYAFVANESNIDLTLRLFDRDGTTLLRYQDFANFRVELATAGTYYLWVQAYSSTATGGYNVSVY